jgi:hypothetical protein
MLLICCLTKRITYSKLHELMPAPKAPLEMKDMRNRDNIYNPVPQIRDPEPNNNFNPYQSNLNPPQNNYNNNNNMKP